jgi:hypothetical protein
LDVLRCLGEELGADVNLATEDDVTAIIIAAGHGHLDVVQYLVTELGADMSRANVDGITPLVMAACEGFLSVVQWLVTEGGASVSEYMVDDTLWHMVLNLEDADDAELTSLLQTMVLLGDGPVEFIAKLSPQQVDLWEQGRQLRTRLPAYCRGPSTRRGNSGG